jgi:hypothetical protein
MSPSCSYPPSASRSNPEPQHAACAIAARRPAGARHARSVRGVAGRGPIQRCSLSRTRPKHSRRGRCLLTHQSSGPTLDDGLSPHAGADPLHGRGVLGLAVARLIRPVDSGTSKCRTQIGSSELRAIGLKNRLTMGAEWCWFACAGLIVGALQYGGAESFRNTDEARYHTLPSWPDMTRAPAPSVRPRERPL